MKIDDKTRGRKVPIGTVQGGAVFRHNGDVYLAHESMEAPMRAIRMSDGAYQEFTLDVQVDLLPNATLVIE